MKKLTTTILILFVCFGCIVKKKSDKAIIVGGEGQTKGVTSFNADDFNCDSGIITIDYDDYAKDTPVTGYLSSEDFKRFVSKQKAYTDETIDKYDTQKVIMLVCDTSYFIDDSRNVTFNSAIPNAIQDFNATWQYGYVAYKRFTGETTSVEVDCVDLIEENIKWDCHKIYLNADKKPLSKSIIVWQTKELK